MNNQLFDKIFNRGKNYGIGDMELYYSKGHSFSIRVFKGDIDNYSLSSSEGMSLRGEYNNQMGYSYTTKPDESSVDMLVDNVKQNAEILTNEEKEVIFEGSKEYKHKDMYDEKLDEVTEKEKIEFAKQLEQYALEYDKRIKTVDHCKYGDSSGETLMQNTKGLKLQSRGNMAFCYINVIAEQDNDRKSGFSYRSSTDFYSFNPKEMAKEACDRAIALLGGKSVKSGKYSIILDREAVIDLFSATAGIFSAESVHKGLSLLKGKLGKSVASSKISVIDDPFVNKGLGYRSFDAEGVACKFKKVIDNGTLTTYLHNLKTASVDDVKTTGNAFKSSYKSTVSIAPTNFYIQKGSTDINKMYDMMNNGLLITEIEGLHAGLNTVSGDFSLSARGFNIKNGKKVNPVEQITISGNYLQLLKDVVTVGDDFKFGMPGGGGYKGAPSLLIENISVAGE